MTAATVMVVEDDEALRESVCELLEDVGYTALAFENGRAALDRLRSVPDKPALILLDLMMPGLNGWQFRHEQLKDPALSRIPVVVMTASRDLRDISADEILYKPLKLERLLEVVRRHSSTAPPGNARLAPVARLRARTEPEPDVGLRRGGGEVGALVRIRDWSTTPLGPIERWPRTLQIAAGLCLASRVPVILFWGRELLQIYNDAFIAIAGVKHPRALGQGARECWPEMWPTIAPMYDQVFATGTASRADHLHLPIERRGYLEESFHTMSCTPVFLDSGEVGGIFGVVVETTAEVVAERRTRTLRDLAAGTAEARTVRDACSLAAQALDGNADIRFALLYLLDEDGATLRLTATVGPAPGDPASPVEAAASAGAPWPFADALAQRRPVAVREVERRFGALGRGPWGHPVDTAVVLPLVRADLTLAAGVVVLGVTPQRALDDELEAFLGQVGSYLTTAIRSARAHEDARARSEALAELGRARTAFFSDVSHEFRTPLALMLGPTEDLLAGAHGELAASVREQLDLVHRNELRLQRLVDALLEVSRLEAGRVTPSFEPVDVAAVTRDLAGAFRPAIERAGLELRVDCESIADPIFVDREMWEKIVLNLLSNAVKFTAEGWIGVSLRREGARAVLRVTDSGDGIAADDLPHVFERFHRVEGPRARAHEGSGIGLALVQELVKLHGGSVWAESELGAGSTFSVAIPLGSAHLPADRLGARSERAAAAVGPAVLAGDSPRRRPDRAAREATPAAAPAAAAARILLAEDSADMREHLRRLLAPHGAVETVEDGEAALAAARSHPPDLIVADVRMPRLDGLGLIRALRADPATSRIRIVVVSARAGQDAVLAGLSAGADDYLTKPFSARELAARVGAQLEVVRLRKQLEARQDQLLSTLLRAPAAICVVRGNDLVYEIASDLYKRIVGGRDIAGKPMLEAVPELAGQRLGERLRQAMRTGQPFAEERLVALDRAGDGQVEDTTWSLVYAPLQSLDGEPRVVAIGHDVTDHVLARRRTQQSEARFRALVEQVEAGIAEVDLSGRFTFVNDRFRDLVGRSAQELLQSRVQDVTHPDDVGVTLDGLQRVVERGVPFFIEKRYVKPDGSIVWVQKSYARVEDDQGRPRGVALAAIDTTQRKFAERALRDSEERSRQLAARVARLQEATERLASSLSLREVAEVFLGVSETVVGSAATVVYFADPATAELRLAGARGLSAEALQGFQVLPVEAPVPLARAIGAREAIWIESHAQLLKAFPALASAHTPETKLQAVAAIPLVHGERMLGGIAVSFEQPRRFDEAERHWLTSLAAQCAVAAERVRLYRGEQSARLEAEALLRVAESFGASQSDLDRLVQRVTDEATALIGAQFGAFFYNVTRPDGESYLLFTLSGAPRDAFAGLGLPRNTPLFGATFRGEAIVRLDDVTRDPRYGKLAPHHGMPAGHLPVTSYLAVPVVARSGAVLGGLFFGHPGPARFTEAHERLISAIATSAAVAIENAQLLRNLQQAVQFSETFVGILGHDLRNPLGAITTAADLLLLRETDERVVRPIERIRTSAGRMERMIEQILDFTRARIGGGIPVKRETVDLRPLAAQLVEELEGAAPQQILLDARGTLVGEWDADRLAQVISNLLGNAVEHGDTGRPIRLELDGTAAEVVRISVANAGTIPASELPTLFDPFRRAATDSKSRKSRGLGLGLYIVQQVVHAHGGRIEARSSQAEGTVFVVELPRMAPGSSAGRAAPDE